MIQIKHPLNVFAQPHSLIVLRNIAKSDVAPTNRGNNRQRNRENPTQKDPTSQRRKIVRRSEFLCATTHHQLTDNSLPVN